MGYKGEYDTFGEVAKGASRVGENQDDINAAIAEAPAPAPVRQPALTTDGSQLLFAGSASGGHIGDVAPHGACVIETPASLVAALAGQ